MARSASHTQSSGTTRPDRVKAQHQGQQTDPVRGIMPVVKNQITALRRHNA
jgi:hypothetical protein